MSPEDGTLDLFLRSSRLIPPTHRSALGSLLLHHAADLSLGRAWRVTFFLGSLIVMLLAIVGFNVINNDVGGKFITAASDRKQAEFWKFALIYVVIFGVLTTAAVINRYLEQRGEFSGGNG